MAKKKITCYAYKGEDYRWVVRDEEGNIIKYKGFAVVVTEPEHKRIRLPEQILI